MRTRILMVNESSVLNTGYSVYGREILNRLYSSNKYEVAELATYIKKDDERLNDIPWKIYTNLPEDSERQEYSSNVINQFGAWKFEEVCLDFRPHIVFNIQDPWMFSYIENSPYRNNFHFVIMPTVDSAPQSEQWLDLYSKADGVFTYTDWSKNVLDVESGGKINTLGSVSPSVSKEFFMCTYEDKLKIKKSMGFEGKNIIGTVMRNQKRKLFPSLFRAFSHYIDKFDDKNTVLYCHTSFPDMGWDIPRLLLQYGISSRVYFTYKCRHCNNVYPSLFKDAIDFCPKCLNRTSTLVNVQNGADNTIFNLIYNMFDLYTQNSNSEGFGVPSIEAAACGIPIMATDYSAMSTVSRNVGGYPIPVKTLQLEAESGAFRAYPDEHATIAYWKYFFDQDLSWHKKEREKTRKLFLKEYGSWDGTAKKWMNCFDLVNPDKYEAMWNRPPDIRQPLNTDPNGLSNTEFVRWLITDVLREPERLGTFFESRMIRDLNYGAMTGTIGNDFLTENSITALDSNKIEFNREIAYRHMLYLREKANNWESLRI